MAIFNPIKEVQFPYDEKLFTNDGFLFLQEIFFRFKLLSEMKKTCCIHKSVFLRFSWLNAYYILYNSWFSSHKASSLVAVVWYGPESCHWLYSYKLWYLKGVNRKQYYIQWYVKNCIWFGNRKIIHILF